MEAFTLVDKEGFLVSYHHHWPRLAAVNQGHYQEYVVEADSQLHTNLERA